MLDQQNWLAKLLEYDMEILYKPRHDNRIADALSCLPEHAELRVISRLIWLNIEEI